MDDFNSSQQGDTSPPSQTPSQQPVQQGQASNIPIGGQVPSGVPAHAQTIPYSPSEDLTPPSIVSTPSIPQEQTAPLVDPTVELEPIKQVAEKTPPFIQQARDIETQASITEIPIDQLTTDQVVFGQSNVQNSIEQNVSAESTVKEETLLSPEVTTEVSYVEPQVEQSSTTPDLVRNISMEDTSVQATPDNVTAEALVTNEPVVTQEQAFVPPVQPEASDFQSPSQDSGQPQVETESTISQEMSDTQPETIETLQPVSVPSQSPSSFQTSNESQEVAQMENTGQQELSQQTGVSVSQPQSQSTQPSNLSEETDSGVSVPSQQFVEKLDLGPQAQAVFDQATQADNPEQVFDQTETERDKQLAEKLIRESGLAPEMVQKALGEKTKHVQEEQSSVPPHQVSEVTTQQAQQVLGSDEYQKESQG